MSQDSELTLRRGLYAIAALSCVGAGIELVLIGHVDSPPQWIPFVLCVLGLGASGVGLLAPGRFRRAVIGVAVALALGSAFGVWEHLEHNFGFAKEIQPTAPMSTWLVEAITGANPALSPGVFLIAALSLWLATWREK